MARLAWFSPMPPARTGVAAYSAGVVDALRADHDVDVFVDEPVARAWRDRPGERVRSAHEFVWRHARGPYDLAIYQLGNSSAHDYEWPYLFRYPGLAVLHDAHLHHARASMLLRSKRSDDYRREFAAAEPDASPDLAELAIAGFDSHLYYRWPMAQLVARASKLTAVHSEGTARWLTGLAPQSWIEPIAMSHGRPTEAPAAAMAACRVRSRHGIPPDAAVFCLAGGLTPEKRVPQVLAAFASLGRQDPACWLVLAGAAAPHYDLSSDIARSGLSDRIVVTGYTDDERFAEYVAGCDVSINLRWPTARELSGPWLHALAASRPTIIVDLAHQAEVPSLDPRTWTVNHVAATGNVAPEPVTVAIDILDEAHSLRLAMRRLATDVPLRERIGRAAGAYWQQNHSPARMLADYRRVIGQAMTAQASGADLPPHLTADEGEHLERLLQPFGLGGNVWSNI